jgi:hypothetical protein
VFGKYYLPEDTVQAAGNSQYEGWTHTDACTVTPGQRDRFQLDRSRPAGHLRRGFQCRPVAFDPFQATQLSTRDAVRGPAR